MFRLRNHQDLTTFLDEVSALVDKKTLFEMYVAATSEAYSFRYVRLTERNKNNMFLIKLDKKLIIDD